MTEYIKRCVSCGTSYCFQGSGDGCLREENDADYCPECKRVIIEALKKIEPKFTRRQCPLEDFSYKDHGITTDTLKEWAKPDQVDRENRQKNSMFPRLTRVASPLFDLETGKTDNARYVKGRGRFEYYTFILRDWDDGVRPATATVEVAFDLSTNTFTVQPW